MASDSQLANRRSDEAAGFLNHCGIRAEPVPVQGNRQFSDRLLKESRSRDAGMIVMGAFGGRKWEGYFRRSTTRAVLRGWDRLLFLHH
jgi:hypothetical protein